MHHSKAAGLIVHPTTQDQPSQRCEIDG